MINNIANQITFKIEDDETRVKASSELRPIADTFEDIRTWPELWQTALDTFEGKRPYPYSLTGDVCTIRIEEDGTWFGDDPNFGNSDRIKISNHDAKELISRFLTAIEEA